MSAYSLSKVPEFANETVDIDVSIPLNWILQPYTAVNAIQVPISRDGDFWLCGIRVTSTQMEAPDLVRYNALAGLRVADANGYALFGDFIQSSFFSLAEFVVNPSHLFRAGTHINVDLQEQSGVVNIVQAVFRGRYRYRMSDVTKQAQWVSEVKRFTEAHP